MGDTIVSLPSFHLIRFFYPKSRITLLSNSPIDGGIKAASSYQLLMGSGLVDSFIEYPVNEVTFRKIYNLSRYISALKFDLVVYLMPPRTFLQRVRDGLFFITAGIFYIRGLFSFGDKNSHRHFKNINLFESESLRLTRSIGFKDVALTKNLFSLHLSASEHNEAKKILSEYIGFEQPFIVISLGTKLPVNDWGDDNWFFLLDLLKTSIPNYPIVFIGSPDEYRRCANLGLTWPSTIINLCGISTPRVNAAILELASLFLGHDCGPIHLASSVGTPCIGIYSARNNPGVWHPFGNESNVFYKRVPCSNCRLEQACNQYKKFCILSISPLEVAKHITTLLG